MTGSAHKRRGQVTPQPFPWGPEETLHASGDVVPGDVPQEACAWALCSRLAMWRPSFWCPGSHGGGLRHCWRAVLLHFFADSSEC